MTMRLLITGASGHIGGVLSTRLHDEYDIRGLDLRPPEGDVDAAIGGDFIVGDCSDPEVANRAVEGVDAVVHLAGIATETDLPAILSTHVETTAALLDAMVSHGVDRMVYASSNHAVGMTARSALLTNDVAPRPDTFYGVGKVAAEGLLSLYADRFGISSVAMRIGSFLERPETRRGLSTWLSYDDCARMVRAALTADVVGVATIYGISNNTDAWWDLAPGRALGYHPQDDAAAFAATIPTRAEDDIEGARVGGPLTTKEFHLPAFGKSR
ncbi:MAG: NAD(P)-dependent oxidoreductase [Actinomycetota bacterium]|nr:NAD(P)-dependent oxidoreductase [Actinomycetota bacterium]